MPLSEFIREERRLAELCNYPNDQDRLTRDMIVSGVYSLRAHQKCINAKDSSLQECINICQAEDAIRMQVQECRPESVNSIQSAQTMIPVQTTPWTQTVFRLQQTQEQVFTELLLLWCPKLDQGALLKCARLRTLCVVNVARKGTSIHYAEAQRRRLQPYTVSGDCTRLQSEC